MGPNLLEGNFITTVATNKHLLNLPNLRCDKLLGVTSCGKVWFATKHTLSTTHTHYTCFTQWKDELMRHVS